jgi:hypothetical protein
VVVWATLGVGAKRGESRREAAFDWLGIAHSEFIGVTESAQRVLRLLFGEYWNCRHSAIALAWSPITLIFPSDLPKKQRTERLNPRHLPPDPFRRNPGLLHAKKRHSTGRAAETFWPFHDLGVEPPRIRAPRPRDELCVVGTIRRWTKEFAWTKN